MKKSRALHSFNGRKIDNVFNKDTNISDKRTEKTKPF